MEQHDWLYYAFLAACFGLAILIRVRRFGRPQRLRLGLLWIVPAIFLSFTALILMTYPPRGHGWLWIALAASVGSAIGWQRGRLVEVAVDPDSGRLSQRSSPAALLFIAALVAARWALHSLVALGDARWHFGAMLVSSILISFAAGVLTAYRVELYLRGRRLVRGLTK